MERWDHASLFAAGSHPTKASEEPWAIAPQSEASELELDEGWAQDTRTSIHTPKSAVRHSGWLLKAYGGGPQRQWRRRYVYVLADRLCYTPDPGPNSTPTPVRYLPLDRIPVRALPRGYGPKLGVTVVEDRQVDRSSSQLSPKKAGCVFSVACGAHTHFFSASSPADAKAWVNAITENWVSCVQHTSRATHHPSPQEILAIKEARWRAENQALRRSLADSEQQRLCESTAQWQAAAAAAAAQTVQKEGLPVVCYEIEVETGGQAGAGTTARVYLELCGGSGSSGDHRLMYRDEGGTAPTGPRTAFREGATDRFKLHCQPLGPLVKVRVYHSNEGPSPAWFLQEVRVRLQGGASWTSFPCCRWLAVDQDDSRVLRELYSSNSSSTPAQPTPRAAPPPQLPAQPPGTSTAPSMRQPEKPQSPPAQRVVQPVWYSVVVCTSGAEGAGLRPAEASAVFLTLHGSRSSSAKVKLPSQAGDFERGQEDVFRVQLPPVGCLEKLGVGLSCANEQAAWLLEQVEVTEEATGETVYFPCSAWLGKGGKGVAERSLLGGSSNPRERQQEVARLKQQLEAADKRLAGVQAELADARAAATRGEEQVAGQGQDAEIEVRLATLQAEVRHLQQQLADAQGRAAAAEQRTALAQSELQQAEARVDSLRREGEAGREQAGADASRTAELTGQLRALGEALEEAQEAAAVAAARARTFEGDARRGQEELQELRSWQERALRDSNAREGDAEETVRRLRAEVAAKAAELREVRAAEQEAAEDCERLSRDLAAERLRAQAAEERLQERLEEEERQRAAASQPATSAPPAVVTPLSQYRLCIHTSSEPSSAGTSLPVCLELFGSGGSTGVMRLPRSGGNGCFSTGSTNTFQLEAPAVGRLQQMNVWLDVRKDDGSGGDVAPAGARWHLDSAEVACQGGPTAYFACRKWLDSGCGYRAELLASSVNPRAEEAEYRVIVHTSSVAGGGTAGNVFVDLRGEGPPSGVLMLRNRGGSFRPGQADEFTFRLPALGALSQLAVGHDGRKEWQLDMVEVVDAGSGTTYFFPCEQAVKGSSSAGSMARSLQLRGYTTDPRSLPVQYRVQLAVEETAGKPRADSLRLTLCGSRGESGAQQLDASRATPGRTLSLMFEGANVGQMERLRIGLAPGPNGQHCGLRVSGVTVTNMPTGEAATFVCPEWLRSGDPYDFELDAGEGQEEQACRYRLEVQTSDLRRAGTAANVFVTIIGDSCTIGPFQLANVEGEHFQRGQLDVFELDGAPDCGQLRRIEVRHDGTSRANDWHLAWIKVSNATTGAVAMFRCKRWVDRRRREEPGAVAAAAAMPPDVAAAAGGLARSAKDQLLMGGASKLALAAAAAAHAPQVQHVHMSADAGRGSVEWTEEGPGGSHQQAAEGAGPEGLPGYRVVFHTSRTCGSGTNAKVHFELTGSGGSSGVLHPVGVAKSFGAGRVDVFEYPALGPLGELQSARVGTDGSGFFPAWHLQLLVVTHLATGRVWQFSCFNWIDKRVNHSRWLTLDSIQEGTTSAGSGTGRWYFGNKAPAHLVPPPNNSGGIHSWGLASGSREKAPPHYLMQPTHYSSGSSAGRYSSPAASGPSPVIVQQQQQQQHLMAAAARPGSPVRVQAQGRHQQQWGGGSPLSPHSLARYSGSGMPGSPLIGARRPGSGK